MTSSTIQRASNLFQTLIIGGALLILPGCFRVTTLIPDTVPAESHSQWVNGFFWGSVGGTVDANHYCGGRPVASVTTKRSVGNYLIELLTLGIYTPSKVQITCGQPRGFQGPAYGAAPYAAPAPYAQPAYPVYPAYPTYPTPYVAPAYPM